MEIVFKMATAPGEGTFEISLKPIEWNLLLLVDGTRSVSELAADTNRTDFEVARIMYGLFSAGLLEVASDDEVERLRAERSERERQAAEMRAKEQAAEAAAVTETLEHEVSSEATAQEGVVQPAEEGQPPSPLETETAGAEGAVLEPLDERPEPEVPEFLAEGATEEASAEDMAVFEEMMGAVLQAPPELVPQPEPAPEPEPEPEPELEPEPEPGPEPEPESAPQPELTGDLETDLRALGLGELPGEDLLEPLGHVDAGVEAEHAEIVFEHHPEIPPPPTAEESEPLEVPELAEESPGTLSGDVAEEAEDGPADVEPYVDLLEVDADAVEIVYDDAADSETSDGQTPDFSDILESLEDISQPPQIVQTEGLDETGGEEAGGVISTDAFLADISPGELGVGLSSGLGDELSALTGAESQRRPTTNVNKLPEPGKVELHRDHTVDKELVLKIIEGIEKL